MALTQVHYAASFQAACDSDVDFHLGFGRDPAYQDRRATLIAQGKEDHCMFHNEAYTACMAHLATAPDTGIAALQVVGEQAIEALLAPAAAEVTVSGVVN